MNKKPLLLSVISVLISVLIFDGANGVGPQIPFERKSAVAHKDMTMKVNGLEVVDLVKSVEYSEAYDKLINGNMCKDAGKCYSVMDRALDISQMRGFVNGDEKTFDDQLTAEQLRDLVKKAKNCGCIHTYGEGGGIKHTFRLLANILNLIIHSPEGQDKDCYIEAARHLAGIAKAELQLIISLKEFKPRPNNIPAQRPSSPLKQVQQVEFIAPTE